MEKADTRGHGDPVFSGKKLRASLVSLVNVFMSSVSSFLGLLPVWRQWSTVGEAMDLESQLLDERPGPDLDCLCYLGQDNLPLCASVCPWIEGDVWIDGLIAILCFTVYEHIHIGP